MNKLYTRFDNVFFEKTRLSMLTILVKERKVSFNRFKKLIGGTDGAIYTHLKKLKEAGYISQKKVLRDDMVETIYSLSKKGREHFNNYMTFLEEILLEQKQKE